VQCVALHSGGIDAIDIHHPLVNVDSAFSIVGALAVAGENYIARYCKSALI